jgi:hypothetical protein
VKKSATVASRDPRTPAAPAAVTASKLDQTDAPQALCHAEIVINCVKRPILKTPMRVRFALISSITDHP